MSQNVTVQGATYSDVPGIELPKQGGGTAYFADTSDANATAADIDSGKTAYVNGVKLTGTGSGGGGGTEEETVRFIDYDGTVVASYTPTDFASLAALPANPSHTGLTAQGWNWTLADAKTYVATYKALDIGQQYVTDDGKTRVYITVPDVATKKMYVRYKQTQNYGVTVDWGDGTTESFTGTNIATQNHTYASAGDYVVTLNCTNGSYTIGSTSTTDFLGVSSSASRKWVTKVEIGSGITDIRHICYGASALEYITIPKEVTSISYLTYNCYALKSVTIPSGVTSTSTYAFNNCYALKSVTIPSSVTSIGDYTFYYCYGLTSVTIPSSVTSIGSNTFKNCYALKSMTIPSGVTSIGNSAFADCKSLTSVTIPSSVTSINTQAFNQCFSVKEYHILPTTPPALSNSDAFNAISAVCKIYVPSASLNTYKTESNWSTYADYMVGE